jgi:hypothetical protein
MTILCLTVVALLLWIVTYRVFYTLIRSVRLLGACLVTAAFILVAQNLEKIGQQWISLTTSRFHLFSDSSTVIVPSPSARPEPVTDLAFQRISREDRSFLDEFLRKQSPEAEQPPKLTVKRAQLVTQNEAPKRAELVRTRQR